MRFGQGRAVLKGMKTETKLSQLVEYDRNGGKVLTIVLNVDQSLPVNRNREFEISVNSKLREIESSLTEKDEIEQFTRCAELGRTASLDMPVVCERFELVYAR